MKIFIVVISLGLAAARFLVSEQVLHVIYGNVARMRDLTLPPQPARRSMPDQDDLARLPDYHEFLDELEETPTHVRLKNSEDFDIKDLNDAMKKLIDVKKNLKEVMKDEMTRRQNTEVKLPPSEIQELYREPVKLREWYYIKLCLTYIIHIRFQVDAAIRYKMPSYPFRGYKLGYLFYRLKSLKTMMFKILQEVQNLRQNRNMQNRQNWRTKKHGLAMVMEWYEKMLHLDVDMKDTVEMIRLIFYGRPMFKTVPVTLSTPILHKK